MRFIRLIGRQAVQKDLSTKPEDLKSEDITYKPALWGVLNPLHISIARPKNKGTIIITCEGEKEVQEDLPTVINVIEKAIHSEPGTDQHPLPGTTLVEPEYPSLHLM